MNRGLLPALLVFGLAWGSFAFSQDTLLQSYALASESLDEAAAALPDNPSLSQEALIRAENALRPLSRDTTSPQLAAALEAVFARAQTAIQNRSATDLAVQAAVLKGGLQRLLYESALRQANALELTEAGDSLAAIASDLGAAEAPQGETAQRLFASFDLIVAQIAQRRLASALAQRSLDQGAAYIELANAYAAFFSVQDSPRLSASLSPSFAQAFAALVNEDAAAFEDALTQLQGAFESFGASAQAALAEAPAPAPAASETPTEIPTEAPLLEPVAEPSPATLPAPNEAIGGVAAPLASVAASPAPSTGDGLTDELGGYGLEGAVRDQLVSQYRSLGLTGLNAALAELYAASAEAVAALQTGNQASAKERLEAFRTSYERLLAPLVKSRAASADADLSALLGRLLASPDLRQQDVAVLIGQVDRLERLLANAPATANQQLMLASQPFWSGWLRLGVVLALAILAFIPLRLLNLAFGGANRNWRLVGIALFLLLLPVIYEGVSAGLSIVAELSGLTAINVLSPFSIFQNTLSQLVWAVLSALAILLAILGLYGICVQFGLLGKRSGKETVVAQEGLPRRRAGNAVEWDEEF